MAVLRLFLPENDHLESTDNGRPGYRDYLPGYYAAFVQEP